MRPLLLQSCKRGTSGKRDCHRASSRNLNVSTDEGFTTSTGNLFQYGATQTLNGCLRRRVFTLLLANLKSITSKPNTGVGSKNSVSWNVKKATHYFEHTGKVTTDSSTDYGKEMQPLEGCLTWDMPQPLNKFQRKLLSTV